METQQEDLDVESSDLCISWWSGWAWSPSQVGLSALGAAAGSRGFLLLLRASAAASVVTLLCCFINMSCCFFSGLLLSLWTGSPNAACPFWFQSPCWCLCGCSLSSCWRSSCRGSAVSSHGCVSSLRRLCTLKIYLFGLGNLISPFSASCLFARPSGNGSLTGPAPLPRCSCRRRIHSRRCSPTVTESEQSKASWASTG